MIRPCRAMRSPLPFTGKYKSRSNTKPIPEAKTTKTNTRLDTTTALISRRMHVRTNKLATHNTKTPQPSELQTTNYKLSAKKPGKAPNRHQQRRQRSHGLYNPRDNPTSQFRTGQIMPVDNEDDGRLAYNHTIIPVQRNEKYKVSTCILSVRSPCVMSDAYNAPNRRLAAGSWRRDGLRCAR